MAVHSLYPIERPLELGFLTHHNPFDRCAFSGTGYTAAQALSRTPGVNLHILGSHQHPGLFSRLLGRRPQEFEVSAIETDWLDVVVGLVATPLLDSLITHRPGLPVLHVTDATPAFLRTAYGWRLPAEADRLETRVAARAAKVVYSSEQMAARAPADLGLPGLHTHTAPFGVNIEKPDTFSEKSSLKKLNLLFVGLDWVRKGGDVAVAILDQLTAMGQEAHLTIVGQCPKQHQKHPKITYTGFLNKNRPSMARKLTKLYENAHFLLLPSRADCTPMVIGEAMAYGTPVLATDTGGIASQIGGRGTGRLFASAVPPRLWAEEIIRIADDTDRYNLMSDACFERAHKVLTWQNWAHEIERLARDSLTQAPERDLKAAISA